MRRTSARNSRSCSCIAVSLLRACSCCSAVEVAAGSDRSTSSLGIVATTYRTAASVTAVKPNKRPSRAVFAPFVLACQPPQRSATSWRLRCGALCDVGPQGW